MNPSPAFQFYPHDFLVGTADFSCEEVGAYIRLLCYQWAKGGLPKDDKKLMQLSGITDPYVLGNVSVKFRLCEDGLMRNDRLEKVRSLQIEYREKQIENGKKGGNPNFEKGKHNPYYNRPLSLEDNRPHNPKINSSSSSLTSIIKREAFEKPNSQEVTEYAKSIEFDLKGQDFLDYYQVRGWKLKGNLSMKDWKAAVRTWKKNHNKPTTVNGSKAWASADDAMKGVDHE